MEQGHFTSEHYDEPDYIHIGEALALINSSLNGGKGISAIHDVATALMAGRTESARAIIAGEWDKIVTYKTIADVLVRAGLFTPVDFTNLPE